MSGPFDSHLGASTFSAEELQRYLASFNKRRFAPALPSENWREDLAEFAEGAVFEGDFLERERAGIRHLAATAPTDADAFLSLVRWFAGYWPGAE